MIVHDTFLPPDLPAGNYLIVEIEGLWSLNQIELLGYIDTAEFTKDYCVIHQWHFPDSISGLKVVELPEFNSLFGSERPVFTSNPVAIQATLGIFTARITMAIGAHIDRVPESDLFSHNLARISATIAWLRKYGKIKEERQQKPNLKVKNTQ
jgi:hypothetical protein